MSSYLIRSHKQFLGILHVWFFPLSVIHWFRADRRIELEQIDAVSLFQSFFNIFFCKRKSMPEIVCVRRRRTQFIILGVPCFQEWLFLDFFVDRLQFLRRFEWRHTLYAQTTKDNNRWVDNFKRQKRGPKGQQCTSLLHHQRFDSFSVTVGFVFI